MIAALADTHRHVVATAISRLCGLGTARCWDALEGACRHEVRDLQVQASYVLAHLAGREGLPIYRRLLVEEAVVEKFGVIDSILAHGDDSDVPAVATRLRSLLARRRAREHGGLNTELVTTLTFLAQFADGAPEAAAALAWARTRVHILHGGERRTLARRVPSMDDLPGRVWVMVVAPAGPCERLTQVVFDGLDPCGVLDARADHRGAGQRVARAARMGVRLFVVHAADAVAMTSGLPAERVHEVVLPAYEAWARSPFDEEAMYAVRVAEQALPATLAAALARAQA